MRNPRELLVLIRAWRTWALAVFEEHPVQNKPVATGTETDLDFWDFYNKNPGFFLRWSSLFTVTAFPKSAGSLLHCVVCPDPGARSPALHNFPTAPHFVLGSPGSKDWVLLVLYYQQPDSTSVWALEQPLRAVWSLVFVIRSHITEPRTLKI